MNGKIIWLASYPKSGNTWFRVFLANLLSEKEGPADINKLGGGPIASARSVLDNAAGIESSNLFLDEVDDLRPAFYEKISGEAEETVFMKTHDAYTYLPDGRPLLSEKATKGAVYLIRNPLDIAPSFANHSACGLDKIIKDMNDEKNTFCATPRNLPNQLRQKLLSWSGHVLSWVEAPGIKIHVVRYEDMKQHPLETFYGAVKFAGFEHTEKEVEKTLTRCSFEYLKKQEEEAGFREKSARCASFFRKGEVGSWRESLNEEQVMSIIKKHSNVMRRFGYLNDVESNEKLFLARGSETKRTAKTMKYYLYGLIASFPFQCPELIPAKGKEGITVRFGEIEEDKYTWNIEGLCYKAVAGKYFLSLKGIAKYLVSEGGEIIIEMDDNADMDSVRLFLYDTVFAVALMQRNCLPLQGSVVVHKGKGIAFLGKSSVGKSIIAAALKKRGYGVMADTICAVNFSRRPLVEPGYPFLMLWKRAFNILGEEFCNHKPVRKGLMKYYFPLGDAFCNKPVLLKKVYLLNLHNKEEYAVKAVNGADKLFALQDFIYNESLVGAMEIKNEQFGICVKTARQVKIKRIYYHDEKRRLNELIDFLEKDFM